MDNIEFFEQTIETIEKREYPFLYKPEDQNAAVYFSEKNVRKLRSKSNKKVPIYLGRRTVFTVSNTDSFDAAKLLSEKQSKNTSVLKNILVLNFANPYTPGGGVLNGANAQEEDLCRRSTLYKSLTSEEASKFYEENKKGKENIFTDAAILSPHVEVFRNPNGSYLDKPLEVAVLTMAAPYVPGLVGVKKEEIYDVFKTRIMGMLDIAINEGYENLVLGAWGCGAFGNDAQLVSRAFFEVFKEIRVPSADGLFKDLECDSLFRYVCFAVLDKSYDQFNYFSFKDRFESFNTNQNSDKSLEDNEDVISRANKEEAVDSLHRMRIKCFEKFAPVVSGKHVEYYSARTVPEHLLRKAISLYAIGYDQDGFVGLIDDSILSDGSSGALFTRSKMYLSDFPRPPKKIWYDEVASVDSSDNTKLSLTMKDETRITFSSIGFNEVGLAELLNEMICLRNAYVAFNAKIPNFKQKSNDVIYSGIVWGNRQTVNRVAGEEIFHTPQGHGFAAEQANNQYDNWHGIKGKVIGGDNAKNGADRLVYEKDGTRVYIQSKYYKTGSECISACFENNKFRYFDGQGNPMVIEVPSDKYEEAIIAMRKKILNNEVPGVKDPNSATEIVKPGNYTYKQAVNIAKAGNIESLKYDAKNGVVVAQTTFGVTAIITFALSLWSGESLSMALKRATIDGLKLGGMTFIVSVVASQLSKAGLNSLMVGSTEAIAGKLGPKVSAIIANACRSGNKIAGAAAQKSAAKILRGNVITSTLTIATFFAFNAVDMFRRRISAQQLFKNLISTGAGLAGGFGGMVIGATAGTLIVPGVGTAVVSVIGATAGGCAAEQAANVLVGHFIEDDAVQMTAILEKQFSKLVVEHLLNKDETEKLLDDISIRLDGKILKEMYSKEDRVRFADELITPTIKKIESNREKIVSPEADDIITETELILSEVMKNEEEGQE